MAATPRPGDVVVIGQVLLGKYRVESILGHGAMGVVTECMHIALNERVAIKVLRQDVISDHGAVERFLREAQAAVKLKSEYVARVSDIGTFENGTPYMVMEYLHGHDLGARIKQQGRLPVPSAIELMLQAAEALSEAHALGIVHRDVKPTNLFVTLRPDRTELIKVLDFGISKAPAGDDLHLTNTQALLGTPAYMSPEQMRSARLVDGRTDIWSLGTVLYELIEGRRPFQAESFSEMCVTVSVDEPRAMTVAPPALQQVILRCLAKSPEQRYGSMADLGRDLLPFVSDQRQGVILVERMQRMLRHQAGDVEAPRGVPVPVRDPASQPVPAAGPPVPASAPTVETASGERDTNDTDRGVGAPPAATRWLAQAPATVPDVPCFDQNDPTDEVEGVPLEPERITGPLPLSPASASSQTPAESPVSTPPRAVSASQARSPMPAPAPAPTSKASVKAFSRGAPAGNGVHVEPPGPPSQPESVVGGDDTFFEVASAHVPPSDRRGDDLVPTPRAPRVPLPSGVPMSAFVTPPAAPSPRQVRGSRRRMRVILLVAALVSGAGALGIALGSRGRHKSARVDHVGSDGSATSVIVDASMRDLMSGSDTGSGIGSDPSH